jgi:putative membrane protein insertion efficiency factor
VDRATSRRRKCPMKWSNKIAMLGIRGYQIAISPILSRWVRCRFYPTCSEYALTSVQRHGVIQGSKKAFARLRRCNKYNLDSCMDLPD